ncbi:MAG: CHAT domain-containing protein [Saprospiraceae bacterium]
MIARRTLYFIYLLFLLAFLLLANQDSLSIWEEKITTFETTNNADSLAYYYQQTANYYKNKDNLAEWAYTYWDWQASTFEDSRQSLAILDQVIKNTWRTPKNEAESEAMLWVQVNRGYHLFQLGKISTAVEAYEAALVLYQQYHFADFEALDYLYLPLGAHYTRLGDNEKARALYLNAIETHPEGTKAAALAGVYNNLGLTYWNEGDQANAIKTFQKGLACEGLLPIKSGLLQLSLAQSYLENGQTKEATDYSEKAIAIFQQIKASAPKTEGIFDYLSGAYLIKARLLRKNNATAQAITCLQQALDYGTIGRGTNLHRDIAKIRIELGRCYLQLHHPEKAIAAFNTALGSLIPDFPTSDLYALPTSKQLYEENAIYEALEGKADALVLLYEKNKKQEALSFALECHQRASETEYLLRKLLQYESSRISLSSQSRQRVEKAISIARRLYLASNDRKYLYTAWSNAEQVKSSVLLEAVQRNRFQDLLNANDTLLIAARHIRQQIAYFEKLLLLESNAPQRTEWIQQKDALIKQLAQTEQQLQQKHPAWITLQQQTKDFTTASIQELKQVMPDYTIVEYFVGEKYIEVFGQSPNGKASWQQVEIPDTVANQTYTLLSLLQSRSAMQSPDAYYRLAYQIYQSALQSTLNALDTTVHQLLIVPDAWLAYLPFEALYYQPTLKAGWEHAPFLLRQYNIHYAFSLAVLENQRQLNGKAKYNILQFAPRFAKKERGLPPLLHSQQEILDPYTCKNNQYLDKSADFEAFKYIANKYKVLHLSTHAGIDTNGLLPQVEFYDRTAYLPDIYALSLQSDLVVLSACQTGLGQFQKGEGIMSLSRAFTYAGAKGLVSSLWAINEAATADLFSRMYKDLKAGISKPTALHKAKIHYLEDANVPAFQKSPYYWSGLVYLGEESAIQWRACRNFEFPLLLFIVPGIIFVVYIGWRRLFR